MRVQSWPRRRQSLKQDIVSMGKSQSYINSKYFYNPVKQNKTHATVLYQIIEDLVSKNAHSHCCVYEDNPLFLDVITGYMGIKTNRGNKAAVVDL